MITFITEKLDKGKCRIGRNTMSDQNNMNQGYPQQYQQMNQGYPQQNYQQEYPQQQYQQMNQQGYPQQQYQQMNQQGYPQQQYQQMVQGYQQPVGGGIPPKGNKPKTGLIVGIVIAAIALIAGIILLVFKDKIFGDKDKEPKEPTTAVTTELDTSWELTEDLTTEEFYDDQGGHDTPEELVSSFWEGFANCDKEQIYQCFYLEYEPCARDAETLYNDSVSHATDLDIDLEGMTTTFEETGTENLADFGMEVWGAKLYYANIPMTQDKDGYEYEFIEKYEGVAFQLENGKWYIGYQKSLGVDILAIDGVPVDDTEETTESTGTSDIDETMFLGYGDLKAMGTDYAGYVDVPSDWVIFYETGNVPDAEHFYQTSDPTASAIVTLCTYNNGQTPFDAASGMYEGLASEGTADEVVSAMAVIGGYEAYQVYAVYGDEYFITYFFTAEDGKLHYVAVETTDDLKNIALNVEGTFRFDK